ncbi:MAG: hypothetical protein ACI4J0_12905 [Huintestinicola sp.]|uniref:hypothetical protein n=1 Tax=Huintestinicola sp. TaxID=2981661 RepID=UPI003F063B66
MSENYSFFAVKNRAVFHRPECRFISGKSPKELMGLFDYDEGRMMGMTPCNCCAPQREARSEGRRWDALAIESLCERLGIGCDVGEKAVCITTGAAEWRVYPGSDKIVLHHESWLYKNRKYGKRAGFEIRDKLFAEPLEAVFYVYCHDKRYMGKRKGPSFAALNENTP